MTYPAISTVPLFSAPLPNYLTQEPDFFASRANTTVLQWNDNCVAWNESIVQVNGAIEYIDEQVVAAANQVSLAGSAGAEQVALAANQVTAAAYQVTLAEGFAGDAQSYANTAAAAGNNKGNWGDLTGSWPAGIAVFHAGTIWISKVALADITAVEPGTDGAVWFDYISAVSAGEVVGSNTDTAGTKLPNVNWLIYRGMAAANDVSARTVTLPSDVIGQGEYSGLRDGYTLGIPGLAENSFGTLKAFGSGASGAVAGAANLLFLRGGEMWVRSSVNASTWGNWVSFRPRGEITPIEDGGTGGDDQETALAALGAAVAGRVADAGIESAASRIVGRKTAGTGALEELSASDARTVIEAAKSGAITGSGLTLATARMVGRTAAGAGAPQEMTGSDVQAFAGIASGSGSHPYVTGNYSACSYSYVKVGGLVMLQVNFTAAAGLAVTSANTYSSTSWPVGFPLPGGKAGGFAYSAGSTDGKYSLGLASSGDLSMSPLAVAGGTRVCSGTLVYSV
jgi:hypothetical protein